MHSFLVIGSNSFSGSTFVKYLLDKGHKVIGISRSKEPDKVFLPFKWNSNLVDNFEFIQLDLNKNLSEIIKLVASRKPQFIVNFAAQGMVAESWLSPEDWYQTNVVSQVKLHDALRKIDSIKRYIHVSTPEAYGSTDGGWIKENYNFLPSTPYAVSRAACDLHLLSFYKAYRFPVIFTRAANVYGPGQQLYRIIPRTMLAARLGVKLSLHGGGVSIRSFIHMDDVSSATYKIAQHGQIGETYHISSNQIISIKDLVRKICKLIKVQYKDIVEETEDRLGKDQSYLLDSDKLRNKLKWSEEKDLDYGLNETLIWIDQNLHTLKSMPMDYQHKK
jgi:dTDP-glucose 4,6-dehydratase